MADPTKYTPSYDFTDFQTVNPSEPLPAQQVDNELAEIAQSVDEIVDAVKDVRRSDGALKNGIVTVDSLDATVAAGVGSGALAAQEAAEVAAADAEGAAEDAEEAQAAAEAARDVALAAAARLSATSASSLVIGNDVKAFVTQSDKLFVVGGWVLAIDAVNSANYMHGQVTSYTGGTLTVNVTNTGGTGTVADWVLTISGTRGAQGPQGPAGSGAGDLLASNNLSELTDPSVARTNLGLTIGVDVQAHSAILDTIAAGPAGYSIPDYFTGDDVEDQFTLSRDPGTENAIDVRFDGVVQDKRTYSVSGTTLTFNDPPPLGVEIEVVYLAGLAIPVGTPGDGTVTEPKIGSGAVTFDKLNGALVVTEAEGISGNDNDTTIPTSAAVKALVDAGGSIDTQTFNANGTWNKPAFGKWARVRAWGAGGSGGKYAGTRGGAGGGGGGYFEQDFLLSDLPSSVSVTVGTGGASQTVASTNGNAGGSSSFGTYLTVYGGGAGAGTANSNGGGGGGGLGAAGGNGTGAAGGAGGDAFAGAGGTISTRARAGSLGGGGGGGCGSATSADYNGGASGFGGGGGGGSIGSSGTPGAGGASQGGGAGGAGAVGASNATAGTAPGGGGGGSHSGNSGAGANGRVVVIVY